MVFKLVGVHEVNTSNAIIGLELQLHSFACGIRKGGRGNYKNKNDNHIFSIYTDASETRLEALRVLSSVTSVVSIVQ